MHKRHWLNLGLLVLVMVLGGIAFVLPENQSQVKSSIPLTHLTKDEITKIIITPNQHQAFTLEKQNQQWLITQPKRFLANNIKIGMLLDIVNTDSYGNYRLNSEDISKFGLEPAQAKLQLNQTEIIFGHAEALKQRHYVKIGHTLHMINTRFFSDINTDFYNYIDLKLLPPAPIILEQLQLPKFTLNKQQQQWQVTPNPQDYATDAIADFINQWQYARAIRITAYQAQANEELKPDIIIKLQQPQQTLKFAIKSQQPLVLVNLDSRLEYYLPEQLQQTLLTLTKKTSTDSDQISP